jgi:hypothetical protein
MTRIILTKCGQKIKRNMALMDELRRNNMKDAMIGCGTLDDNGNYIEIADVYFLFD